MRNSKLEFTRYLIIICFLTSFYQCEEKNGGADESFIFPEIEDIDSIVYDEIKKTCREYWDLSKMIDDTFAIVKDMDEYTVHCDGYLEGILYHFAIRVDKDGKWVNDGRTIKDQSP